jgi:hypothetical protein
MKKSIVILTLLFFATVMYSQETEKDSIGTEEVNIVKPYTPKIKDAFKLKKNPVQGKDVINDKKTVQYSINSVPVASTFTPSKGKAKGVTQKKKERIYENYASVGFGNNTTPKIELFAHTSTTRDNDIGVLLNFLSSNGGVKDANLDTDFMDAKIGLYYKESLSDFDWKVDAAYQYQKYNWYGLFDSTSLTDIELAAIDPKQTYNTFSLGGQIDYYDSFFKGATFEANLFSDHYSSSEAHYLAKPKFEIPISSELIDTEFRLEYVGGKFDKNYFTDDNIDYGFYNLGVSPTFKVLRDYLTVNLGAKLIYSGGSNGAKSEFFIYPNVTASYELIQDVLTLYAGVTGDLKQNTFRNFVTENPFVSPTLNIERTNEKYNAKIGAKGKLASNISFNVNASYKSENAKALFKLNEDLTNNANTRNYQYANAFGVVYDNVNTVGVFGEINIDFSKEFRFGGNVQFSSYDQDLLTRVWNLPSIEASVFANYNIDKWFAGAQLFFVGERKDEYINNSGIFSIQNELTNKSYIDLNLNFGYNFTNRLTAFANANNVLGTNYKKFTNFQVQGIQVLAGIKYKFDL